MGLIYIRWGTRVGWQCFPVILDGDAVTWPKYVGNEKAEASIHGKDTTFSFCILYRRWIEEVYMAAHLYNSLTPEVLWLVRASSESTAS